MPITKIFIQDLQFFGFHGLHDFERAEGNDFAIDIYLWVDESARETDKVVDTYDYSQLPDIVEQVNGSKSFITLEHLGNSIATQILEHPRVQSVKLNLRKVSAPMSGQFQSVGIELELGSVQC